MLTHDERSSIDVLILTATKDEQDEILLLDADWQQKSDSSAFDYYVRFDEQNRAWAVARSSDMGPEYAANLATRLVKALEPECLAMVGVCAGYRKKVNLGDVIVAERLFNYDAGKMRTAYEGLLPHQEVFRDLRTYNLDPRWRRRLEQAISDDWAAGPFRNKRPVPLAEQKTWLLCALFAYETKGGPDPRNDPERKVHCPDWPEVVDRLENEKLVSLRTGDMLITAKGSTHVRQLHERFPDGTPRQEPRPRIHVAPMATGSKVVEDEHLFTRIHEYSRKTLAVDMEGYAISAVAELESVKHFLVVKGVQDFGSTDKDDRYRGYAIEAAYRFLRYSLSDLLEVGSQDSHAPTNDGFGWSKTDDILSLIYHHRELLISKEDSLRYDRKTTRQYELWQVQTPKTEHILVLFPRVSIARTVEQFLNDTKKLSPPIRSLSVIRITEKRGSSLPKEAEEKLKSFDLSSFGLQDFIKDYCVESKLFKPTKNGYEEPYYTDQPIYSVRQGGKEDVNDFAVPFLKKLVTSTNQSAANIVLAEGGDGKTSLCYELANAINCDTSIGKAAVLLRIDEIRDNLYSDLVRNFRISSVFDIYDLFATLTRAWGKDRYYPKVSRTAFEVSVVCGNLVVIIDGLDELYTVFHERFDIEDFISSLKDLSSQLRASTIIITSRGNIFEGICELGQDVSVFSLRGFSISECEAYFANRFKGVNVASELQQDCLGDVRGLMKAAKSEKISPFVVDLVAFIRAQQAASTVHGEEDVGDDESWLEPGTLYPNNNTLTDIVVFNVLRRERNRQRTEITVEDMVELFSDIAGKHGQSISLELLQEDYIDPVYTQHSRTVLEHIRINPLVRIQEPALVFRYNFLYTYFFTLFVLRSFRPGSSNSLLPYLAAYARLGDGSSKVYKDILMYVNRNASQIDFASMLRRVNGDGDKQSGEVKSRAISLFVHLIVDSLGQGKSRKDTSETLFSFFQAEKRKSAISNLHIHGSLVPLKFSGLDVAESSFVKYKQFLDSDFDGAHFSYSIIDLEHVDKVPFEINRDTFDQTCKIGNLSYFLKGCKNGEKEGGSEKEVFLRRFFREFFQGNSFVERRTDELRIGGDCCGAYPKFFREACSLHLIWSSSDGKICGVTRAGTKAVADYLNNNRLDRKLNKVLNAIELSS